MSTENILLKQLTFTDLTSIRDNFKLQLSECLDIHGIPKIDGESVDKSIFLKEEIIYLDRYILGKYKKVKSDSLPKKA